VEGGREARGAWGGMKETESVGVGAKLAHLAVQTFKLRSHSNRWLN